jgi:hypothetical protein
MKTIPRLFATAFVTLLASHAFGQHLHWNLEGQKDATCLYGEITVLETKPSIYYCGANWHPGEHASGYCGIQHNSPGERRTIFSIWDTSPALHPSVTEADPATKHGRFGGEGEGGHTHMISHWKAGETFQFFVQKKPGTETDTTDTRYYIFQPSTQKWIHSATIGSPNGGFPCVATIGGGLNSFLENYLSKDKEAPKVALYRLWLGNSPSTMKFLTRSGGDGTWGQMHQSYFLAEGAPEKLHAVFTKLEPTYGKPVFSAKGTALPPLNSHPLPPAVATALKTLPQAPKVKN